MSCQWRRRWLLRNWRYWRWRLLVVVVGITESIHSRWLRLQSRREHRVDASLHRLLGLRETTKACGLRSNALKTRLAIDIGLLVLLLLLNSELRLRSESRRLRNHSVLELTLAHEARSLRLHLWLETLTLRNEWRTSLRKTRQLSLQGRGPKGALLLRKVLRRR